MNDNDLTTTPVIPSEGAADPQMESVPAKSIVNEEGKKFSKTPAKDSKTTLVVSDPEEELRKLCDEADAKAKELLAPYYALQVRISGELFPILLRIKSLLPHGEWTPWYENFCQRHHITTSLRTVQRAFADLTDNKLLSDGTSRSNPSRNAAALKQAAEMLALTKAELGKSAEGGCEQAKAIIASEEKNYADAVTAAAKEQQATAGNAEVKPSPEMRVNKRLASIVEIAERYIRVMERVVHTAPQTERQKDDLEKTRKAWRKVLQDARTLSWAVQVIEKQDDEEEAA